MHVSHVGKDQYILSSLFFHTKQTDLVPRVWKVGERNREEKEREGHMGINIALWPLKRPSALQKSSKHSLVSFLTNPKGQPSCFLLLLYESRLASTSIFIGQFDVCSHHLMKPWCCCSLFQRVDVTGMWTNPKVVSTDKELCLSASLGNVNQFPTQGFLHKASHFFWLYNSKQKPGLYRSCGVDHNSILAASLPALQFYRHCLQLQNSKLLSVMQRGGRNLQARLDSWFSLYHITVQCSCWSSSFSSPPYSSPYIHISTFPYSNLAPKVRGPALA